MNRDIVGNCPTCGAPIYAKQEWTGDGPPPSEFTCDCRHGGGTQPYFPPTPWMPPIQGQPTVTGQSSTTAGTHQCPTATPSGTPS